MDLCFDATKEALPNKHINLAALTFIELIDLKFKTDLPVEFKFVISFFDYLKDQPNISSDNEAIMTSGSSFENLPTSSGNVTTSPSQGSIATPSLKESQSQDQNLDLISNQGELSPLEQIKS